jgi:release factor glutamine methyltransferase
MVYTSTLTLFRQIRDEIKPIYGPEADMLAMLIVEEVSGFNSTDILVDNKFQTGPNFRSTILKYILQLKRQEPIQYILGKAYFYENMYAVNASTLIPRPETEELVKLVLDYAQDGLPINVLDIGVGSGCIATTIALNLPNARVDGLDVSMSALLVAKRNAEKLGAEVNYFQADIFTFKTQKTYDVIISNPPYVRESEKKLMNANVIEHEPAKALFVPDNDPLLFYNCIAEFSKESLSANGVLFFEVNEAFASEVVKLLEKNNFHKIELVKDINGKDRFVYGLKAG